MSEVPLARSRAHVSAALSSMTSRVLLREHRVATVAADADRCACIVAELALRHRALVTRVVAARVPRQDAEDVVASALAAAATSVFSGTSEIQFKAWLLRIARRRAADYYRRRASRPQTTDLDDRLGAQDDVTMIHARVALLKALGDLNPRHRQIVGMFVLDDRPAADVADALRETPDNIYKVAERFRRTLRQLLVEEVANAAC